MRPTKSFGSKESTLTSGLGRSVGEVGEGGGGQEAGQVEAAMEEILVNDIHLPRFMSADEANNILAGLREDNELHSLLADARMRSEAHRNNYNNLKAEHTKLLHELKVIESENARLEANYMEEEENLRIITERAAEESRGLRAQIIELQERGPSEENKKHYMKKWREEVESEWKATLATQAEQIQHLEEVVGGMQQENHGLRTQLNHAMTDIQGEMEEVVLKYENVINTLRNENEKLKNDPVKIEKENEGLKQEAINLERKNKQLSSTIEEYDIEIRRYVSQISEIETSNFKVETDLKSKIKKLEAECSGLECQLETYNDEVKERDIKINELSQDLTSARQDLDLCQIKMEDSERACAMKISENEIKTSKDSIFLHKDIEHKNFEIDEYKNKIEKLTKDFNEQKSKHRIELSKLEEELSECKTDNIDKINAYEVRQGEMIMKIKTIESKLVELQNQKIALERENEAIAHHHNADFLQMKEDNKSFSETIQKLKIKLKEVEDEKEEIIKEKKATEEKMDEIVKREQANVKNTESKTVEIVKKCKTYNKLIHKLRNKLEIAQVDTERYKLEKEAMAGYVSPESHSNLKKQLMDLQHKQEEFATVFGNIARCEELNEERTRKLSKIHETEININKLKAQSEAFLNDVEKNEDVIDHSSCSIVSDEDEDEEENEDENTVDDIEITSKSEKMEGDNVDKTDMDEQNILKDVVKNNVENKEGDKIDIKSTEEMESKSKEIEISEPVTQSNSKQTTSV